MLEIKTIESVKDRLSVLKKFNPDQEVWVTSDIKSRDFVQQKLQTDKVHNNSNKAHSSSVFRALDFWQHLLSMVELKFHVVSRNFLVFYYQKWAHNQFQNEIWKTTKQTGTIVCEYLKILAHLLPHPDRDHLFGQWLKLFNKTPYWKAWYDLAVPFWEELNTHKVIESSWIDVYLLDKIKHHPLLFKKIVFDLSCEINTVEIELACQLATNHKVQLLVPVLLSQKLANSDLNYHYATPVYNALDTKTPDFLDQKKLKNKHISYITPLIKKEICTKQFATQLAEVKDIVSEVSSFLKQGVPAHNIAVLAPKIEDYWFCLKSFLKKEGINCHKQEVVCLSSFPFIQLWLAKLWTHLDIIEYENLETIVASTNKKTEFQKFRSAHYYALTLKHVPPFCYDTSFVKDKNNFVSGNDFINWVNYLKPTDTQTDIPSSLVLKKIKECLSEIKTLSHIFKQNLSYKLWLSLLESLFKSKEIVVKNKDLKGVQVLSFNALSWVSAEVVYVAGLNESLMKNPSYNLISQFDKSFIKDSMGFFLKEENPHLLHLTIQHFIQQKRKKIILSCSKSDFSGGSLSPDSLWLYYQHTQNNHNPPHKDICHHTHNDTPLKLTVWDQQQRKSTVADILNCKKQLAPSVKLIEQSLKEDVGTLATKFYCTNSLNKISPYKLHDYVSCPFVYFAKHVLHLWSGPEKDDVDRPAMQKGSLLHALFEKLKSKKHVPQILSPFIEDIKDEQKSNPDFKKLHPVVWAKEKLYLLKKAKHFLENERSPDNYFKKYHTKAREVEFTCYWDHRTQTVSQTRGIPFKGRIDRIDSDGTSYMVLDYKGTLSGKNIAPNWSNKKEYQMAIYIQALEKGLVGDMPALPVKVALFLSYKDFTYKGLVVHTAVQDLDKAFGGLSKKTKSLVSQQQKYDILQDTCQQINTTIFQIQEGDFTPSPQEFKTCDKCQWRKICRAPHLN